MFSQKGKNFIFIAGVEGAGHHLLADLYTKKSEKYSRLPFFDPMNKIKYNFSMLWRILGNESIISKIGKNIPLIRSYKKENIKDYIQTNKSYNYEYHASVITKYLTTKPGPFMYSSSFPFGRNPRNFMHFPSINVLKRLTMKVDLNFKIIYIKRDINACINSVMRRGFSFDRMFEENMKLVHSDLLSKQLEPYEKNQMIATVNYEDIIKDPLSEITRLNFFLELNK